MSSVCSSLRRVTAGFLVAPLVATGCFGAVDSSESPTRGETATATARAPGRAPAPAPGPDPRDPVVDPDVDVPPVADGSVGLPDGAVDAASDSAVDAGVVSDGGIVADGGIGAPVALGIDPSLVGVDLPVALSCTGTTQGNVDPSIPIYRHDGPFTVQASMRVTSRAPTHWKAAIVADPSIGPDVRAAMGWTGVLYCGTATLQVLEPSAMHYTATTITSAGIAPCTTRFTLTLAGADHFTVRGSSKLLRKQRITGIPYTTEVQCEGAY